MVRLEYFIVCRSVSLDIDNDEITLSHVIEDVFPEELPTLLPKIVAVSSWQITPPEFGQDLQATLKTKLPGEQKWVSFPMNLAPGRRRYRAMISISEIPLGQPGTLEFEVLLNNEHGASHVVAVHPPGARIHNEEGLDQTQTTA